MSPLKKKSLRVMKFVPPSETLDIHIHSHDIRTAAWQNNGFPLSRVPESLQELATEIFSLEQKVKNLCKLYDAKRFAEQVKLEAEAKAAWKLQKQAEREEKVIVAMTKLKEVQDKKDARTAKRSGKISIAKQEDLMSAFEKRLAEMFPEGMVN